MVVFSFDHPNNRELNRALIRNVQAVVGEKLSDAALVKCELNMLSYNVVFHVFGLY